MATRSDGGAAAGWPAGENAHPELGRRFAAGEPEALRELYERYAAPVFTVAMSRLRDEALAEEAVQDVFVKAWRSAGRFDPRRKPGPWLYQIARRTAADLARQGRRRPVTTDLSRPAAAQDTTTIVDVWEAHEVRRALQQLSAADRELLHLTHHLGLTRSQIARRLAMPLGTVKSHIHRAHRRLAVLLAHLREPDPRLGRSA